MRENWPLPAANRFSCKGAIGAAGLAFSKMIEENCPIDFLLAVRKRIVNELLRSRRSLGANHSRATQPRCFVCHLNPEEFIAILPEAGSF